MSKQTIIQNVFTDYGKYGITWRDIEEEIQAIIDKEFGKNDKFYRLQQLKQSGKVGDYYDKIYEILGNWKEECRNNM